MDNNSEPQKNEDANAKHRKPKRAQDRFLGRMVTKSPLPQKVKDFLNMDAGEFFRKMK